MKSKINVAELLRWRYEQAKAEAAVAPGAVRLLSLAMPWRERSPQKFQSAVPQLDKVQFVEGQVDSSTRHISELPGGKTRLQMSS